MLEPKSTAILRVHDVHKAYGVVRAVDGVSFSVAPQTTFTLLGPNGAGKTTTLEILEGLREPDSGEIELFGERVRKVTPKMKERLGVLLQDGGFEPYLKVREVLELFSSFFAKPRPVKEVLQYVELEDKAGAQVRHLSGGQRQRLALAVALINDPDLLFLDEPTTGLDPQARRKIWTVVENLKAQGKTVVLTTHYMEEAEALSDWVVILDHGKIMAEGSPRDLTARLGQETFLEFEIPGLSSSAWAELSSAFKARQEGDLITVTTHDLVTTMDGLVRWSRQNGMELKNVVVRQPNLEDVFLSLTGRRLRE